MVNQRDSLPCPQFDTDKFDSISYLSGSPCISLQIIRRRQRGRDKMQPQPYSNVSEFLLPHLEKRCLLIPKYIRPASHEVDHHNTDSLLLIVKIILKEKLWTYFIYLCPECHKNQK